MKLLLIGDLHLSDRAPQSCTEDYLEDLITILEHTISLETSLGVDGVVWSGDVFHQKQANRNSHSLVQRAIDIVQAYKNLWIVPGNHDLCVPEDTEALTDQGWKTFADLSGEERFATLNPDTGAFEWQLPTKLIANPGWSGDLVRLTSRRTEQVYTPNHDVWTSMQHATEQAGVRTRYWAPYTKIKAEALATRKDHSVFRFKLAADSWVGYAEPWVKIPASGGNYSDARSAPGFEVDVETFAEFLGWYLSEGSCEKWRVVVSQSQEVHPFEYDQIVQLVEDMGLVPQLNAKTVRISNAGLSEFLCAEFGRVSYEKRIPSWVKDWPVELLRVLFDAYLAGDGTTNGAGWTCRSNSKRLIDDLTEICVKLGLAGTISDSFVTDYNNGTVFYKSRPIWNLSISPTAETGNVHVSRVPYSGLIWCPSLPNGIWMQRRRGRACWTGNSYDRFDSIDSQPLGVLFKAGAKLLNGWADDALPLYGVPWQQEWTDQAVRTALHEHHMSIKPDPAQSLVVAHAPLYRPGTEPAWENYPTEKWAELQGTGWCMYGHVHERHGVYKVGEVTFCNHGAITRGSLHESELNRAVVVTTWSAEEGFIEVPVPHKPASAVFRLLEKRERADAQLQLDEFLEKAGQATLEVASIEAILAHIRTLDVTPDVVKLAEELLAQASG